MHSIIIPHYRRERNLALCIRSVQNSAQATGLGSFEIVVVEPRLPGEFAPSCMASFVRDRDIPGVRVVQYDSPDTGFNKCGTLNMGIEAADGDLLTFLDADAFVGRRWLEGAELLRAEPSLTRICYRVRQLKDIAAELACEDEGASLYQHAFPQYEEYPIIFEAYFGVRNGWRRGRPIPDIRQGPDVFGNSQFTIRRDDLDGLLFDPVNYPRAGHEDLDFIKRFADQLGERYNARILTDAEHAMFHFASPRGREWGGCEPEQRMRFVSQHGDCMGRTKR